MLQRCDCDESMGFAQLHKTVLGLIHKDLETELSISTSQINFGDARQRTSVSWATMRNDLRTVQILLAYGADVDQVDDAGNTPLFFASTHNVCKILLLHDANIEKRSKWYSLLHCVQCL